MNIKSIIAKPYAKKISARIYKQSKNAVKIQDKVFDEDIIQKYPSKKNSASRKIWLRHSLPFFLRSLKVYSQCTECRGRTTMPNEDELNAMSYIDSPGALVYAILGHFHCISAAAAKRQVCALSKTLKSR